MRRHRLSLAGAGHSDQPASITPPRPPRPAPGGDFELPDRVEARNGDSRVRLVVDEWTLGSSTTAADGAQ